MQLTLEQTKRQIRHLAASYSGKILAAAEFERSVHLWDLEAHTLLKTIETTLDFGGDRLAMSPDSKTLAVGSYNFYGMAAYSTSTGAELWRRKDLKKVQQVAFSNDSERVLCCREKGSCERLNAGNGKSGQQLRDVRNIFASPHAPLYVTSGSRNAPYRLQNNESKLASIPRITFAILSVAFSESQVCISEAAGPVRCCAIPTGEEIWRYVPPSGIHFLEIGFCAASECFCGLSWSYGTGGHYFLHCFDPSNGVARGTVKLGTGWQASFCCRGACLVNNFGSIFQVPTGQIIGKLDFASVLEAPKSRVLR